MKCLVSKHHVSTLVALSLVLVCVPAFAADLILDFDGSPGTIFPSGTAEWRPTGGVDDSGYLSITDAVNNERGVIIIGDLDDGQPIVGFDITADLRVGGGTDRPADGFSFNFARFDDPAILDVVNCEPIGTCSGVWSPSPAGEANLPEEGTTTGFAIGFDEWQSGPEAPDGDPNNLGFDVVGLSLRIDETLIAQAKLPVLNVGDDEQSLQTGPAGVSMDMLDQLGWEELNMKLDAVTGDFSASWKGEEAFLIPADQVNWEPTAGALVFGGRTGGANAYHHIDNIRIRTFTGVVEPQPWPGDVDGDGHTDVSDLNIIGTNWQMAVGSRAEGDLTGDGFVDVADLNELGSNWQTWDPDAPMAAAVPEPSSVAFARWFAGRVRVPPQTQLVETTITTMFVA